MTTRAPDPVGPDVPDLKEVEERIQIEFSDRSLLQQAFVHRSFVNEVIGDDCPADNERLEFLGDSVLGFIASDYLYRHYPELNEGALDATAFISGASQYPRQAGQAYQFGCAPLARPGRGRQRRPRARCDAVCGL